MILTRRGFFAASALLGNAVLSRQAVALPRRDRPAALLVLCGGTPFDAPFFAGAVAGCRSLGGPVPRQWDVHLAQPNSFARLRQEFGRLHGASVIGLLESGSALLAEQALLERRAIVIDSGDVDITGTNWPYFLGHNLVGAPISNRRPPQPTSARNSFNLVSFAAVL